MVSVVTPAVATSEQSVASPRPSTVPYVKRQAGTPPPGGKDVSRLKRPQARTAGILGNIGGSSNDRTCANKHNRRFSLSAPVLLSQFKKGPHPVFAKHARTMRRLLPKSVAMVAEMAQEAGALDERITACEVCRSTIEDCAFLPFATWYCGC